MPTPATPSVLHRISAPLPAFDPEQAETVLAPEAAEPGYWTGCAGVLHDAASGRWLLTYRRRRPRGHAGGERGWRCAVAESEDGVHFTDIWAVEKSELGTDSMERFSILPAADGRYQLYLSYVDPADSRWRIDMIEADSPDAFDLAKARPVLTAAGTGTEGVKDPYVFRAGPVTYLYASYADAAGLTAADRGRAHATSDIYNTGVTTHPTGLAVSTDGATFDWHGRALATGRGWDRYQARLNSVVALPGSGYLGFYDGSAGHEENYEERCGLAVSHDLFRWRSLTPAAPWVTAPTTGHATGSVRYVDALIADGEWRLYFETTRADGAHELRLARIPAS